MAKLHHALMNPLTVVVGYSQLLAARRDLPDDVRTQVNRILDEARECVRLIERSRQPSDNLRSSESAEEGGRFKILVVDDEPVILKLASEVLGGLYDVIGVQDGDTALRSMVTADFDLVLLDMNLGGEMDGRALYETLLLQQPEMAERVVFITGGTSTESENAFLNSSGRVCIRKPFHIKTLRDIVARNLPT
jgi:CheY-like chemotaxis protein